MKGKRTTLILATIGVLGVILAFVVGVDDNPPAVLLLWAASTALVLAFTHTWRQARKFVILLLASVAGLVFFAVLHNVFHALAEVSDDVVAVSRVLGFLGVLSFYVAIFLGGAGILVGAVGAVLLRMFRRD